MALNDEYFDSISIDVVKKKYYNANKVEAVLADIRRQAAELTEENRRMHEELDRLNGARLEIGTAVISAQSVYQDIVAKANAEEDEIVGDANRRSKEIISRAMEMQDYAVQRVEACYARVKEQHMEGIESINAEWQQFLIGLMDEPEAQPPRSAAEETLSKIADDLADINSAD